MQISKKQQELEQQFASQVKTLSRMGVSTGELMEMLHDALYELEEELRAKSENRNDQIAGNGVRRLTAD